MDRQDEHSGFRVSGAVLVSAGIVFGVLIGIVAMMLMRPHADPANSASMSGAVTPTRWFIWSGNEPLLGDPFPTGEQCETSRKKVVADAEAAAKIQLQNLPALSINQIRALGGNPADAILQGLDRVRRAYCVARP